MLFWLLVIISFLTKCIKIGSQLNNLINFSWYAETVTDGPLRSNISEAPSCNPVCPWFNCWLLNSSVSRLLKVLSAKFRLNWCVVLNSDLFPSVPKHAFAGWPSVPLRCRIQWCANFRRFFRSCHRSVQLFQWRFLWWNFSQVNTICDIPNLVPV